MNDEKQRETSRGGKASHESGYGHETNSGEGGESSRRTGQEDSGHRGGNMSRM